MTTLHKHGLHSSPVSRALDWIGNHWYGLRGVVADLGLVTTSTVLGISQDAFKSLLSLPGVGFLAFAGFALFDSAIKVQEIPAVDKLQDAEKRLEMAHIEYGNLFRGQLHFLATRLGLSHTERISVYEFSAQYNVFRRRARYSSHTEYNRTGRHEISAGEGCVGKALNYGKYVHEGLPDKATQPEKYEIAQNSLGMSKETLEKLKMPTRSYAAYAINNQNGSEKLGVVVFESTEEYLSVDEEVLKQTLDEEERHIRFFLEFMGKLDPISAPDEASVQSVRPVGERRKTPAPSAQADKAKAQHESELAKQLYEQRAQRTSSLLEEDRELTEITETLWHETSPSEEAGQHGFMILPAGPTKITTLELWELGLLYEGKKLLLRTPQGVHPAEVLDGERVTYKGHILTYTEFGKLATGWTTINIYAHIRTNHLGVERTLEELRSALEDELERSQSLKASVQNGKLLVPRGILPGLSALLARNRLSIGEKLYFTAHDHLHSCDILPQGRVRHNNQELKVSDWCKKYCEPSAVSYYVRLHVIRQGRTHYLDQLMRVWHSNFPS